MISHTYCPYLLLIVLWLLITSAWHIQFNSCLLLSLILFQLKLCLYSAQVHHLLLMNLCLLLLWGLYICLIEVFDHKHIIFCMHCNCRINSSFPRICKHNWRKNIWVFSTERWSYCSCISRRNTLIDTNIYLILIKNFFGRCFYVLWIISSLFLKFFLTALRLISGCVAKSFFQTSSSSWIYWLSSCEWTIYLIIITHIINSPKESKRWFVQIISIF